MVRHIYVCLTGCCSLLPTSCSKWIGTQPRALPWMLDSSFSSGDGQGCIKSQSCQTSQSWCHSVKLHRHNVKLTWILYSSYVLPHCHLLLLNVLRVAEHTLRTSAWLGFLRFRPATAGQKSCAPATRYPRWPAGAGSLRCCRPWSMCRRPFLRAFLSPHL